MTMFLNAEEEDASLSQTNTGQRNPMHFPLEREIRFRTVGKRDELMGSGMTINMSSKNLVFRTDRILPTGKQLEMAISWPARLDQKFALKLVASGTIMRADLGIVAVSIERFEFRTLGTNGLAI